MKASQQAYWTIVQLPFHISLVLLSEGGSQWDVWWRALESFHDAKTQLTDPLQEKAMECTKTCMTTSGVVDELLDKAFSALGKIPDQFWDGGVTNSSDPNYDNYLSGSATVLSTVMNAISDAFDISVDEKMNPASPTDWNGAGFNTFGIPAHDQATPVTSTDWDKAELAAVDRTVKRLLLIVSTPTVLAQIRVLTPTDGVHVLECWVGTDSAHAHASFIQTTRLVAL